MGNTVIPIVFDERSHFWCKDDAFNAMFLKTTRDYLIDLYNARGYIYLDRICDTFGAVFNPNDENLVWIKDRGDELVISYTNDTGDSKWYLYVEHRKSTNEKIEV